ncbi:MAG: hybrid sensor histidine kinase/response regulator [Magnetococcales bacterium]|nr:hybrid sensor histidine kinase/response regulator [Magnetococcales bacterium]
MESQAQSGGGYTKSSAMIEDQELRELFAAESEEHVHALEKGLLHLEKHPDDMAVLKDLFREAHSLKGAARMLGVRDVEALSHHFEDFLGAASKGQRSFTSMDVDRLTRSLDDIRALVEEAVTGKPSPISLPAALNRLTQSAEEAEAQSVTDPARVQKSEAIAPAALVTVAAAAVATPVAAEPMGVGLPPIAPVAAPAPPLPQPVTAVAKPAIPPSSLPTAVASSPPPPPPSAAPAVVSSPPPPPSSSAAPMAAKATPPPPASAAPAVAGGGPELPPPEGPDPFASSEEAAPVIRVRSNKLDALLRLVGELTVVRTRVKRRLLEIEEIIGAWEELQRSERAEETHSVALLEQKSSDNESLNNRLLALRHGILEDEAGLELVADALEEGIRNLRLLPLSTLFGLFPRLVRDLARQQEKEVLLLTEGGETTADKRILEEMKSPLMHLIRNAVDHGLEQSAVREQNGKSGTGTITLRATQTATHVVLEIRDDGRGLNLDAIRRQALKRGLFSEEALAAFSAEQLYGLIFQSGFSTSTLVTDVSGRGVGLDVVRAQVERLKGRIQVSSELNKGCCFTIALPVTLATTPVFIAMANGQSFAIPLDAVHSVRRVVPEDIFPMEGCDTILLRETGEQQDRPVSVARLALMLDLPPGPHGSVPPPWPCIILNVGSGGWLGVICDTLEDELEVVLKPFGGLLQRVRNLSGTTILGSGTVCMVINPQDLLATIRKHGQRLSEALDAKPLAPGKSGAVPKENQARKKTILLAEDSLTTRTQEKRILQGAGYEVIAAVDGLDALNKLGKQTIDAVVSDVQMPNLDGLSLAQKIRQNPLYKELPIILVTSLSSDEDMRRGMEVGANAYITKPTFEQKTFLETLQRLV